MFNEGIVNPQKRKY